MMNRRKPSFNLSADKGWCAKHLARGTPAWCIKRKDNGLVVSYLAGDISSFTQFEGVEVDAYTVQQMVMRDGSCWFGPESAWPRPEGTT